MTLDSMPGAGAPLDPSRLHPSIALAPYVEALVVGRRVAVIGDASLGLADALVARGARLVHAYDPDPARVAEAIARRAPSFGSPAAGRPASRGVAHALLSDDLGVRDGAFDAVILPDLCLFADRTDVVRRAKRLVAPAGAVIVASPNPDAKRRLAGAAKGAEAAPGYYEIFDLLSLQFRVVRMVGQAPFVGYAIVDFAADREPDVSFDASLMAGTEEPESFVAIASDRAVSLDPYVVVEVPASQVLGAIGASAAAAIEATGPSSSRDVHRSPNDHVQLAEMQARLVLMEAELDDLRAQKGNLSRQLDLAKAEVASSGARSREVAEESAARAEESARVLQAERFRELEARAGDEHVRAERLGHKVRDLEEELVHQRDRAQKLTKQLDDEKKARQKAEIELGMTRGLPKPEGEVDAAAARIEELTAALRHSKAHADSLASELLAKSKETAELRRELEAAEERIGDLRLEREASEGRSAELSRERDEANGRVAGLSRELDGANGRVAELSRERDAAQAKVGDLSRALQEAQARLDDMEQEATTLRRPQPIREPVVVAPDMDSNMMARITRLEASTTAATRAASEARKDADDLRREATETKREASESRRALEIAAAQKDAAIAEAARLAKELDLERGERKDLVIAKASLEAEVIGLKRRVAEVSTEAEAGAGPEVMELESALRDRGMKIAALERDLRESERIGRELISEIEALREASDASGGHSGGGALNGHGGSWPAGQARGPQGAVAAPAKAEAAPVKAQGGVDPMTAQAYQHRIDALASDAAKKQAELLTSTWKIQALERELSEARTQVTSPSRAQVELSGALVRAQSEIADLRKALAIRGEVPRAAVEDAVLLHQQMAR